MEISAIILSKRGKKYDDKLRLNLANEYDVHIRVE